MKNQKTSIAPAAVISQKKLSLKLYMCKTIFEREFTKNRRKSIPTRCAPPNY